MTEEKDKNTKLCVKLRTTTPTERFGNKILEIEITKFIPQSSTIKEIEDTELELEKFIKDRIDLYHREIKGLLDFEDFEDLPKKEKGDKENGKHKKTKVCKTG